MRKFNNLFSRFPKSLFSALAGLSGTMFPFQAHAYDWTVVANPTHIEGTYMPTKVGFQIDQAGGTCVAGAWLTWNAKGATADEKSANTAAILSMIMTARVANRSLTVIGNNSGCTVDFLYLN